MANKLLIFDGPDKLAMKIGEVYGTHYNRKWKSISSSGMMFIDFKKQVEYNICCMQLKASIKYTKFIPDCQTWLDLRNNTLKSPDKYNNNINCSWLLSFIFGSYITIQFNYIYVSSYFVSTILVTPGWENK